MNWNFFTKTAAAVAAGILLGAAGPASAQAYVRGTVHNVTPQGVYIDTPSGITFVPRNSARFAWNNRDLNWNQISRGRRIDFYQRGGWRPSYVPRNYYNEHPGWTWERQTQGWGRDRNQWRRDRNGRWERGRR